MRHDVEKMRLTYCVTCFTVSVHGDDKCPKCGTPMNEFGYIEKRTEKKD